MSYGTGCMSDIGPSVIAYRLRLDNTGQDRAEMPRLDWTATLSQLLVLCG